MGSDRVFRKLCGVGGSLGSVGGPLPALYLAGVLAGARAPPEFGGSQKGQSLISAYRSLAITASTSGFEKLSTALLRCQL